MLDPWIIEEIRRREDERSDRPEKRIEVPFESPRYPETENKPATSEDERGVVVIDI